MSQEVVWLIAFGTLLLAYSLYWGIAAGRSSGKAQDFFLAGRKTPAWVFVLSATALSLTKKVDADIAELAGDWHLPA